MKDWEQKPVVTACLDLVEKGVKLMIYFVSQSNAQMEALVWKELEQPLVVFVRMALKEIHVKMTSTHSVLILHAAITESVWKVMELPFLVCAVPDILETTVK